MRVSIPRHRDRQLNRLPALLGFVLAFCLFNSSVYAQCASPPGNEGTKEWFAASAGSGPTGCSNIGDVCSDGSVFAGDTNMYAADADQGMAAWSTEYVDTGADSTTNGAANQQSIIDNQTLSNYPAFELCANLDRHGHQDWYLPAMDELNVLYQNRVAIGNFDLSGSSWASIYWASTEVGSSLGRTHNFNNGTQSTALETYSLAVRCVRRDSGGTPTPATYKFCIDGNWVDLTEDGTLGACATEADWDYDAAEKTFKQCDGTDWKKITCAAGGGGSCDHDTWTARESDRNWMDVASSSDGTKLVATAYNGQIYTSTDSGATWTARDSNRFWTGVASSSDGTKLVAAAYFGQLYTSTNSGVSWTARDSNRFWYGVASSSDGTKLVAAVHGGQIYTSTNSGVNWTARDSNRNWYGVASSSDGTKLVAMAYNGQIYTSTDSGVTWTPRESNRNWYDVASSADGTKLAAVVENGQIYISTDSGVTWTAKDSNRSWWAVASSDDGTKLVAVVGGQYSTGKIYTSECLVGGSSCTSLGSCSVEGRMEYDTVNDVMMYCDGADWFPLAEATP